MSLFWTIYEMIAFEKFFVMFFVSFNLAVCFLSLIRKESERSSSSERFLIRFFIEEFALPFYLLTSLSNWASYESSSWSLDFICFLRSLFLITKSLFPSTDDLTSSFFLSDELPIRKTFGFKELSILV